MQTVFDEKEVPGEYYALPELTPNDIPDRSGFYFDSYEAKTAAGYLILDAVVQAVKDPKWLETAVYGPGYKDARMNGESTPQSFNTHDLSYLNEFSQLETVALQTLVYNGGLALHDAHANFDVAMRALQILTERYPDISVYRGASYDPEKGFTGNDFAFANFVTAYKYAQEETGPVFIVRKNPVIVRVPVAQLIEEYTQHKVMIDTKEGWFDGTMQIYPLAGGKGLKAISKIHRFPTDAEKLLALQETYRDKAIPLF